MRFGTRYQADEMAGSPRVEASVQTAMATQRPREGGCSPGKAAGRTTPRPVPTVARQPARPQLFPLTVVIRSDGLAFGLG